MIKAVLAPPDKPIRRRRCRCAAAAPAKLAIVTSRHSQIIGKSCTFPSVSLIARVARFTCGGLRVVPLGEASGRYAIASCTTEVTGSMSALDAGARQDLQPPPPPPLHI